MSEYKIDDFPFMIGTAGNADYVAVARRGMLGLGFKPQGMINLPQLPGHMAYTMRVRVSPHYGCFDNAPLTKDIVQQEAGSNVISLNKVIAGAMPGTPAEAFPIAWQKAGEERASTTILITLKGTIDEPDELIEGLKTVPGKIVEWFKSIAGEHMVLPTDAMHWMIDKHVSATIEQILEVSATNSAIAEQLDEGVGTIQNSANLIKKAKEKLAD